MDYSKIDIAKRVLEKANVPVPDNENEIRKQAYKCLSKKDFLAAHSIRLGKNYPSFAKDEWKEIIRISGEDAIKDNIGALALCMRHGLLTL